MLQSVPSRASAKPRLICHLDCVTPITVQVIGPNTLYIAETDTQLMINDDSGLIDALQINQASGAVTLWMKGDVWAAGSQAVNQNFKPIIYVPGNQVGSGIGGQQ